MNNFTEDRGIQTVLPLMCKLTEIFCTIPITSCSAEGLFFYLRHLKNYLRSTMGQERLSTLEIEKDVIPHYTKNNIEKFAMKLHRKLPPSYSTC